MYLYTINNTELLEVVYFMHLHNSIIKNKNDELGDKKTKQKHVKTITELVLRRMLRPQPRSPPSEGADGRFRRAGTADLQYTGGDRAKRSLA